MPGPHPHPHLQGILASEEEDLPVAVEETYSGNYIVVFDPLDGSSNIDAGISVGSIFGIYEPSEECSLEDADDPSKLLENCVVNVCQPGHKLLAAGYCLYSSSSIMVLTIGDGVYGFTLDPLVGEFVLTHPDVKIPEVGFWAGLLAAGCWPGWWNAAALLLACVC
jgi:fructose-1,6-bisphosphatase I